MTGNFFAFLLLLSVACYLTMGGKNENENMAEEILVSEQPNEETEFIIEEIEAVEETVAENLEECEISNCPGEHWVEEVAEEIPETPSECGCKKARRLVKGTTCKCNIKPKPALCPCCAEQDVEEVDQMECAAKISTKKPIKLVKRFFKKVAVKEAEAETCNSNAESVVEQVEAIEEVQEKVDAKQTEKTSKQVKTEATKQEKAGKLEKGKQEKTAANNKQVENAQKSSKHQNKQNKGKGQKKNAKKSTKTSKNSRKTKP